MSGKLESIQSERVNFLDELFVGYEGPNFAVRLWDGSPGASQTGRFLHARWCSRTLLTSVAHRKSK